MEIISFRIVATRTIRTGIQAGLGVVTAAGLGWVDAAVWQLAGTTAVAAAFTAIHNALDEHRHPTVALVPGGDVTPDAEGVLEVD